MEHNILVGVVVAIPVILGTQLLKRSKAVLKSRQANKVHLYELASKFQGYLIPSKQLNTATAMEELDRVLGGGLVSGSVILLGGDRGIGKSTLLLQVASKLNTQLKCFYVTGEEALDQIRLRAQRLHIENSEVYLLAVTNVSDIIQILEKQKTPSLLIVDSIQTVYNDLLDAAPGTVSQVRSSTHELIRFAKVSNTILILVGHVTKEGTVAGPRVLEHMVDTVLYFEGEANQFRILRSVKNRFGPTSEIGVFKWLKPAYRKLQILQKCSYLGARMMQLEAAFSRV